MSALPREETRPSFYTSVPLVACPWCTAAAPVTRKHCAACGHRANVRKQLCDCRRCEQFRSPASLPEGWPRRDLRPGMTVKVLADNPKQFRTARLLARGEDYAEITYETGWSWASALRAADISGDLLSEMLTVERVGLDRLKPYLSAEAALRRWPRLAAHQICESLGYFTPVSAAANIALFKMGDENWCEYVYSCWQRDPGGPLRRAVRSRHSHRGYMANYYQAVSLVFSTLINGQPADLLASWF